MGASIVEPELRASDEVLDSSGDENLAGAGGADDACADMNGEPRHLPFCEFTFTCVETRTELQPILAGGHDDRTRALDRPRRAVKGGEDAVAGGIDFFAAKACELASDELVVPG